MAHSKPALSAPSDHYTEIGRLVAESNDVVQQSMARLRQAHEALSQAHRDNSLQRKQLAAFRRILDAPRSSR
ncbi:MAG TPA: hypothetical protein VG651_02950 [Stellaceae bacterium]|nr:hypothetical protein [Stellaceae bacterium]